MKENGNWILKLTFFSWQFESNHSLQQRNLPTHSLTTYLIKTMPALLNGTILITSSCLTTLTVIEPTPKCCQQH